MSATHPDVGPAAQPLKFAANLSWLYTDLPFLDRFEAAARDGFQGVECLFPQAYPQTELQARLRDTGLQWVLFNAEPGNWAAGERGLASLEGREADFQRSVHEALALANALNCPRVHVMAGLLPAKAMAATAADPMQAAWSRFEARMAWAAEQARQAQCTLMVEPINRRDMPGYVLTHQAQAHELVQSLGSPHLKVQMDLYHCQITEGDVSMRLRHWLPTGQVGHLQIAAVPDRGEPDQGELHYAWLFDELRRLNWQDWIGCEYRPRITQAGGTSAGLGWWHQGLRQVPILWSHRS